MKSESGFLEYMPDFVISELTSEEENTLSMKESKEIPPDFNKELEMPAEV